eukprot:3752246-Prymnesium_polylepis.1
MTRAARAAERKGGAHRLQRRLCLSVASAVPASTTFVTAGEACPGRGEKALDEAIVKSSHPLKMETC